jgi:hypothetical protein
MPGAPSGSPLVAADSRNQELFVALIANATTPASAPQPVDIVLNEASGVTASATAQAIAIDSATLPIPIQVGQWILFRDAAGSYPFKVTTLAAAGATTELTGIAYEDIPDNATAQFPTPAFLAQEFSTSDTTGTTSFSSFDHDGSSDTARGESEQSVSFSIGSQPLYNCGEETLLYAKNNEIDVVMLNYLPNPDANTYTTNGPIEWFTGLVTDLSRSGANNEKMIRSASIGVRGGFRFVDPA